MTAFNNILKHVEQELGKHNGNVKRLAAEMTLGLQRIAKLKEIQAMLTNSEPLDWEAAKPALPVQKKEVESLGYTILEEKGPTHRAKFEATITEMLEEKYGFVSISVEQVVDECVDNFIFDLQNEIVLLWEHSKDGKPAICSPS